MGCSSKFGETGRPRKPNCNSLVKPLETTLTAMDGQVRELEQKREGAYQVLQNQMSEIGKTHTPATSDDRPTGSGPPVAYHQRTMGELQLRRVVELAGMVEHVDFDEQVTTDDGRPDMIIRLPDFGILPVDAKTPMTAFLTR